MRINGREVGSGHPPFCIAEMSGEHKGSIDRAFALICAAKEAGADAIKAQLFDPLKLAEARGGADKVLTQGLWKGRTLGDLYQETHTPKAWFPELFKFAALHSITLFSSVFDEEGVDYLETLGCPAYKVSSFSITDLALIRKAASTGKPLIISTGMASDAEIGAALELTAVEEPSWMLRKLCDAAILHCVSAYPCPLEQARLSRVRQLISHLAPCDGFTVGLSDHTDVRYGSMAAVVATALGASIIEKHITLDRNNGGPDAAFSLEPKEFAELVQDVKDAYASLGTGERPKSEDIYRDLRHGGSS